MITHLEGRPVEPAEVEFPDVGAAAGERRHGVDGGIEQGLDRRGDRLCRIETRRSARHIRIGIDDVNVRPAIDQDREGRAAGNRLRKAGDPGQRQGQRDRRAAEPVAGRRLSGKGRGAGTSRGIGQSKGCRA